MIIKKRIAILGGSGFIGEYLVNRLSETSDIELVVIDRKDRLNFRKLVKKIEGVDCLILLHQPNPELTESIAKGDLGIKKIIFTSTLLLYPDSTQKQKETSPVLPISDYEVNKLKEENILSNYAKKTKTKLCIVRLANVYGDIKNKGIIQKILTAILTGEKFTINGDGNQKRDYLFIEDAVNILAALIFSNQKRKIEIFNICSAKSYSILELITAIKTLTQKKLQILKNPSNQEKLSISADNKKVLNFTSLKIMFNLERGLNKTYHNYLKHVY